jgi:hypothetical protein
MRPACANRVTHNMKRHEQQRDKGKQQREGDEQEQTAFAHDPENLPEHLVVSDRPAVRVKRPGPHPSDSNANRYDNNRDYSALHVLTILQLPTLTSATRPGCATGTRQRIRPDASRFSLVPTTLNRGSHIPDGDDAREALVRHSKQATARSRALRRGRIPPEHDNGEAD